MSSNNDSYSSDSECSMGSDSSVTYYSVNYIPPYNTSFRPEDVLHPSHPHWEYLSKLKKLFIKRNGSFAGKFFQQIDF